MNTFMRSKPRTWNYIDVLALVVAHLGGNKFKATGAQWHQAVEKMRDRFPDLLEGVHFRKRGPLAPYSPEVEEFLTMLDMSGYTSLANPVYQFKEITEDKKNALRQRFKGTVPGHIDDIKKMSVILGEYIST